MLKPQVKFDNMNTAYKTESNVLGIYITENMKRNVHISH